MTPPLVDRALELDASRSHVVLMVHGLGGGPYEVQRLGEWLHAEHALSVRAIQLPGHDGPGPWMPPSRWTDWYTAVERAHASLAARFERVDLVGFSTGCPLVLHHAATHPARGRVVLLAPFVRIWRPDFLPFALESLVAHVPLVRAVPRRGPPLRDPIARREVAACARFRTFNIDAVRSALALIATVSLELDRVRAPVLVVQGQRDSVVDARGAAEWARALGARLIELADSDHLVTLDAERDRVLREVSAFLVAAG